MLQEFRLEHEGLTKAGTPLLGFCHGSPGTANSLMIKWVPRMFVEALGWHHEDEFLRVAFQNKVAHAMGATILHAGGYIGVGGQRPLEHTVIDVLLTRSQYLRWVIIDELPMVPDNLLGAFASHLAEAASPSRYDKKLDGSVRFSGVYNLFAIGDVCQIPPIPSSASLAVPRIHKDTEGATQALDLMWADGKDS